MCTPFYTAHFQITVHSRKFDDLQAKFITRESESAGDGRVHE